MSAVPFRHPRRPGPVHSAGEVTGIRAELVHVRIPGGAVAARVAASCLLRPEPGDTVLVSGASMAECYLIAVLERAGDGARHLELGGDTVLSVRRGSLKLAASERVDVSGGQAVALEAPELRVHAGAAHAVLGELSAIGRVWNATFGQLRLVGQTLDSVLQRVSQHARQSLRTVEESDQVRSGEIDYRADGNLQLNGLNTLVSARELVKLNGDQVHLG